MPGYPLAAIDRSRVKKKDLCPKCEGLLREAVQTITCGHRFCKTCFALILSDGEGKCTIDGTVVKEEEVFQDKFVERELQSLVVHCVRNDLGCSWEGELRRREEHDAVCEFGKVPCVHSECGELVTRAELLDHLQSKCNYRMEKCEFCHNPVLFAAMKDHHQSECASVLVSCPECGMQGIPRAQVATHIDPVIGDCEEVQAPCPMAQIGCSETEVMKLRDRRLHLEKNFPQHLLLVFRLIMGLSSANDKATDQQITSFHTLNGTYLPLQREFERSFKQLEEMTLENRELKSRVQQQEDRIKRLERTRHDGSMAAGLVQTESTLREITRRINNEEAKTSDLEVLIVEGHRATEELQREMVKLKREDQVLMETVGGLQRQLDSLQHNSALRNMALADLEEILKQQEVSSHNGVLVWKIPDFARKRQDAATGKATSHYSPIFYTGHHGYKMCARIYLNGDGMGRGTHISVFFVIMRGRFDPLLRWPFRQKVTMMLLDQDNVEHVIDAFRPDPNSSSFQRPRREMNVASGCPLFCPLSELSNHAYVRDDAMFIKIIVDTSEL